MIPQNELNTFRAYLRDTPARMQSTQGWTSYLKATGVAGAYDSARPQRQRSSSRPMSFREMYHSSIDDRGRIAYDQKGSEFDPNTGLTYNLLCDEDPRPQAEVETTDAEPPNGHGIHGRAPPAGPYDEPRQQRVQEPRLAQDPYTEQQRKAFGAAAGGHGQLGIDPDFARRALHEDAALGEIEAGQQGREVGPEDWQRTRGRDQEHIDEEQDQALIDQRLTKLLQRLDLDPKTISQAVARDRRRRAADRARRARDQGPEPFKGMPEAFKGSPNARLAGDSASFARMPGADATRLLPRIPAQTPRVFVSRSMAMDVSASEYAPYHTMAAFKRGEADYKRGNYHNPYSANSVEGQAWDRGAKYAMRVARGK